ncbi:unnamed protein product [Prunus brigantina]
MLMSKCCYLRGANEKMLFSLKEETSEMGGYFIVNGIERVARLHLVPKRNYPMSLVQKSFRDRGIGFTDKAIEIRCVREDQSAVTVRLYYLESGNIKLGFRIQRKEYFLDVGVVLQALRGGRISIDLNSKVKGIDVAEAIILGSVRKLAAERGLSHSTQSECIEYIGEVFQPVIGGLDKEAVGNAVLTDYVFVHLDAIVHKFSLLKFMVQKLFSLVSEKSKEDNPNALQNQEVLLPGHLITIYLKEKLEGWLQKTKRLLEDEINKKSKNFDLCSLPDVKKVMNKNAAKNISSLVATMLKTGRLDSRSGDLQQKAGFTVLAERVNYLRFISHFRAVHRGASFVGRNITNVRKLLPESWGFLCPVHAPDGQLCGLLNHMTSTCRITSYFDAWGNIRDFAKVRKSVMNYLSTVTVRELAKGEDGIVTLLDGCHVGYIPLRNVGYTVARLRWMKVSQSEFPDLEVGYVPVSLNGIYPGLYLFTSPSRFVRPVKNLAVSRVEGQNIELIGPFEQVFMEIRCPDGRDGGRKCGFHITHEEINPIGMLSVVASLTPWSDHNHSPRNMHQCQMAKQAMGFSLHSLHSRADQKLYHLLTPQSPIVRTSALENYCIDEYPTGINAIVAVVAYTGFDMEDGIVLNKSSVERGMFHGQIYQTETVDLSAQKSRPQKYFRGSNIERHCSIDSDGLPYVGQTIKPDEEYYSIYNEVSNKQDAVKRKGLEAVVVDSVAIDLKKCHANHPQKVNIRFRHPRNPVVGDKFSSRHGQKGVCSQLLPDVDMPFSGVTGMRPDLIINPHSIVSRMTVGMFLESIAAKASSLHGKYVDATPFANSRNANEETKPKSKSLDELGEMLKVKGFNYHGLEVLYSGFYGTELPCEIFIGPVHYQRLRQMVSDILQVRSTGTVDHITRQPINKRNQGGAIRFGEMERDSLLAHGAAFLLQDRLHKCSDHHIADVCTLCGSILTPLIKSKKQFPRVKGLPPIRAAPTKVCRACNTSEGMETVSMPYVFKYLAAELAAMNIKLTLKTSMGSADDLFRN